MRREKSYIMEAKNRRFHPGALAALQFIVCLNLASAQGTRWQVPDAVLQGLHHFCSVPRDVIALSFASEQLFQPQSVRQTSEIVNRSKRALAGVDAARARAAWVTPQQRARALQACYEV